MLLFWRQVVLIPLVAQPAIDLQPGAWTVVSCHFEMTVHLNNPTGKKAFLWLIPVGSLVGMSDLSDNRELEYEVSGTQGFIGMLPGGPKSYQLRIKGDGIFRLFWEPLSNQAGESLNQVLLGADGTTRLNHPWVRERLGKSETVELISDFQASWQATQNSYVAKAKILKETLQANPDEKSWRAYLHFLWGKAALNHGFLVDSEDHFQQSENLWRTLGFAQNQAEALKGQADVKVLAGELPAARFFLEKGLALLPKSLAMRLDFKIELGWISYREEKYGEAIKQFRDLRNQVASEGPLRRGAVLDRLASAYLGEKKYKLAIDAYKEAIKIYEDGGLIDQIPVSQSNWAATYLKMDRYKQAINMAKRSQAKLGGDLKRQIQATNFWVLGHAEWNQGSHDIALNHFDEAMQLIEEMRKNARGEDLGQQFFNAAFEFAEDYLEALYQMHLLAPNGGFARRSFLLQETWRRRGYLANTTRKPLDSDRAIPRDDLWRLQRLAMERETLADASNRQREAEELAVELNFPPSSGENFSGTMNMPVWESLVPEEKTLVLTYVFGFKHGFVWVLTHEGLSWHKLSQHGRIRQTVRDWLAKCENPLPVFLGQKRRLVTTLREDILPESLDVDTFSRVLILPDGDLVQVPFHLIFSKETPKYPFWPTHPLEIREHLADYPARKVEGKGVLVVADPIYQQGSVGKKSATRFFGPRPTSTNTPRGDGLDRLQGTKDEADAIRQFALPLKAKILLRETATREMLFAANPSKYQVLHFGAHGAFIPEKPEYSGIILGLYNGDNEEVPGFLSSMDIRHLELRADVVVLSTCVSAKGRIYQVGGVWGLSRTFLQAGAKGVLASLWQINDEATATWMTYFYQAYFQQNQDVAMAALTAQRRMMVRTEWQDPSYWAGFHLLGQTTHFEKK